MSVTHHVIIVLFGYIKLGKQPKLTCNIVVPGRTWTGLSSMKTSTFSGCGAISAKRRAASGAARVGELSASALDNGWRSILRQNRRT